MDFVAARETMVTTQLAARGITEERVLTAMRRVSRHEFVTAEDAPYAYDDGPVRIGSGQTMSQPYMVAVMTQLLEPQPGDTVLEIGTGSGYQAAVLAELVTQVYTIERHAELAEAARARLERLGYENIHVMEGDGTLGYDEAAPFDGIMVTAGGPRVPPALRRQLAMNGRLVCPVGDREKQRLIRLLRTPNGIQESRGVPCVFVPLVGQGGWAEG